MSGCGCFYRMEGSMETEREGKNAAITAIRWSARVLTVISVIFAGLLWLMAIGEGGGNAIKATGSDLVWPVGDLCRRDVPGAQMGARGRARWRGSPPRSPR